jgi:hypothetical protein
MKSVEERFWSKVIKQPNGCWIWTGGVNAIHGYGRFCHSSTEEKAHRYSYRLAKGEIPEGLNLLHSCDVRRCVNPDHLKPGSQLENVQDCESKDRFNHPQGESHGSAKLTAAQVEEIRGLAGKMPHSAIAAKFGMSRSHVGNICRGAKW